MGDPDVRELGAALRAHRTRTGMTQRQLADLAGVSVRTVRYIEQGRPYQPRTASLRQLSAALSLTPRSAAAGSLGVDVLGPLVVRDGDQVITPASAQQRCLLGLLALHANQVVSRAAAVDTLWTERPPTTYRELLHTLVSRLRKRLPPTDPITTHEAGYQLVIAPEQLDLTRFTSLVEDARTASDPLKTLTQALDCWRGPVLADLPDELRNHPTAIAVTQQRLTTVLAYADLAIEHGQYAQAATRLRSFIDSEPLHEGLHTRLMLALAASGHQADALAVFGAIRNRLSSELAVEPGPELQQTHLYVLRGNIPVPREQLHERLFAGSTAPPATSLVPRQLPADVAKFTGRDGYLEQLDALLTDEHGASRPAVVISAISGIGGVGKTALALHWAHRIAAQHPDGQLYVNLRGYASTPPMMPTEALAIFLRALGVPQVAIPLTEDEQAAMYRSLLADRRVLIVLDNAATVDQVRPLLPGSPTCLVLVTSRDDLLGLTALDDAHRLVLNVLSASEAYTLLTRIIGSARVEAERDAAEELAKVCGYLPLALRIAGAHLASDRDQTIAGYLSQLTGNTLDRLAIANDRQAAVRASFDLSYRTIEPNAARLFRLLGLVPGADFGAPAAAALIDVPADEATRLLARLTTAHLVESPKPGRYALHDLLRLYGSERACAEDTQQERDHALGRLFDMYLHSADRAVTQMYPSSVRMLPLPADVDTRTLPITGLAQAKVWLDAERPNLVEVVRHAADHGPRDLTWRLADVLAAYCYGGMYRSDWLEMSELGLRIAGEDSERTAEAAMMHVLHRVHFAFGDYDKALDFGLRAREQYPPSTHPGVEAEMCKQFGHTYWLLGRLADALANFDRARVLYQRIGNRASESICMNGMSLSYMEWGRFGELLDHTDRALALHREIGSRLGEAAALHIRAMAYAGLGEYDTALETGNEALSLYHLTGFRFNEASVMTCIAGVHRDNGRYRQAIELSERAMAIAKEFGDTRGVSLAHTTLASTYLLLGQLDSALEHGTSAVSVARNTGYRRAHVDALVAMAAISHARDQHDEAIEYATSALAIARECEFQLSVGAALTVLADVHLGLGATRKASEFGEEALAVHRHVGHRLGEARTLRILAQLPGATADSG